MYDQAHQQGYDVFIHSCGNINAIYGVLFPEKSMVNR
jgi:hypothetical protein